MKTATSPITQFSRENHLKKMNHRPAAHFSPTLAREPAFVSQLRNQLEHITEKSVRQSKLASLGQLSACIGHDLNQPLFYFKIICESTLKDIEKDDLDIAELRDDLLETMGQLATVQKMIDQILYYSRPSDNLFQPMGVQIALDRALILMGPKMKRVGVCIREERQPQIAPISGLEVKIEQMFINLMQNSIDAMAGQNKKEITLKLHQQEKMLRIEFSDNGPGISSQAKERIFEPFFTTKKDGHGTGLGLAIVADIIKEHQGTIHLKGDAKTGAHFVINLPTCSVTS